MKSKNTDIPLEIARMLDSKLRLFDGDISLTELMHMDIPLERGFTLGRRANLAVNRQSTEDDDE